MCVCVCVWHTWANNFIDGTLIKCTMLFAVGWQIKQKFRIFNLSWYHCSSPSGHSTPSLGYFSRKVNIKYLPHLPAYACTHTHTQIHPEIAAAVAVFSARGKCSQFNIRNNIEYGLQGIFQQCFCTALCVLSFSSPLNISLIDGHPMSSHIYTYSPCTQLVGLWHHFNYIIC